MKITVDSQCQEVMSICGLEQADIEQALDSPNARLVVGGDPPVFYATAMRSDGSTVFVTGEATSYQMDPTGRLDVLEARVLLALVLYEDLPVGVMEPGTAIPTVLSLVADSFGLRLCVGGKEPSVRLYRGPWPGHSMPSIVFREAGRCAMLLVAGILRSDNPSASAWAFCPAKYQHWLKTRDLDDRSKIATLAEEGFWVFLFGSRPGELRPQNAGLFGVDPRRLAGLEGSGESLVLVTSPQTEHRYSIRTSDPQCIAVAEEARDYQEEPVSAVLSVDCVVVADSGPDPCVVHLHELVASLDGAAGMTFQESDTPGSFRVIYKVESAGALDVQETLAELGSLLDCVAATRRVGVRIVHFDFHLVLRSRLDATWGQQEVMLPGLTRDELNGIILAKSKPEAMKAAGGLNQAYMEPRVEVRLAMLWRAAEDLFGTDKGVSLLTDEEVAAVCRAAAQIQSLAERPGAVDKIRGALKELKTLSRNERMAEAIGTMIGQPPTEVFAKLKAAAKVRGRGVHTLKQQEQAAIAESVGFLEDVLHQWFQHHVGCDANGPAGGRPAGGAPASALDVGTRLDNPCPEIAYQEITLADSSDLGSGSFRFETRAGALAAPTGPGPKSIVAAVVNPPSFQMAVTVNPGPREVAALLGRADGTDPLSAAAFVLPGELDPNQAHEFEIQFANWQLVSAMMDGGSLRLRG